ncbi:hypothetical protein B0H10DRAFT_1969503 [Mycena sp. CBHHK59/15]|nr:hypothetical protein B0H10DRAFT_1969503 [Mycena sp. CBHHK59/15]
MHTEPEGPEHELKPKGDDRSTSRTCCALLSSPVPNAQGDTESTEIAVSMADNVLAAVGNADIHVKDTMPEFQMATEGDTPTVAWTAMLGVEVTKALERRPSHKRARSWGLAVRTRQHTWEPGGNEPEPIPNSDDGDRGNKCRVHISCTIPAEAGRVAVKCKAGVKPIEASTEAWALKHAAVAGKDAKGIDSAAKAEVETARSGEHRKVGGAHSGEVGMAADSVGSVWLKGSACANPGGSCVLEVTSQGSHRTETAKAAVRLAAGVYRSPYLWTSEWGSLRRAAHVARARSRGTSSTLQMPARVEAGTITGASGAASGDVGGEEKEKGGGDTRTGSDERGNTRVAAEMTRRSEVTTSRWAKAFDMGGTGLECARHEEEARGLPAPFVCVYLVAPSAILFTLWNQGAMGGDDPTTSETTEYEYPALSKAQIQPP